MNPLDALAAREEEKIILEAIAELPPKYQKTIILIRLNGLSYEETAQKLGVSKNTIKSNLRDALSILKNKLNHHFS